MTTVSPDGAAGTASSRTTASDPTTLPDLRYVWTEVGLGATDVTYEASTVVTATFGCVNGGSNRPSASNKTTISAPVSATVRLSAERNGRIAGNLDLDTAGVGPAGFDCPPGQDLTTISASFTQITLTDVTNDTSVTADDITVILKP